MLEVHVPVRVWRFKSSRPHHEMDSGDAREAFCRAANSKGALFHVPQHLSPAGSEESAEEKSGEQ